MIANDILLDAFTRVHESLHRTLGDITPEELVEEPHPFLTQYLPTSSHESSMNPNMTRGQRSLCAWSASWRMP
jgi:hypothetical protein